MSQALRSIGFDQKLVQCLHEVVAAVLHLGQVSFVAEGDTCSVTDANVLRNAADLLGEERRCIGRWQGKKPCCATDGPCYHLLSALLISLVARPSGIDANELEKALTSRTVAAHGEVYETKLVK